MRAVCFSVMDALMFSSDAKQMIKVSISVPWMCCTSDRGGWWGGGEIRLVSRVIALTVLQWDGQYNMRLWSFPDLIWCQRFGGITQVNGAI